MCDPSTRLLHWLVPFKEVISEAELQSKNQRISKLHPDVQNSPFHPAGPPVPGRLQKRRQQIVGAVVPVHHAVVLGFEGSVLFALRKIPCGKMLHC